VVSVIIATYNAGPLLAHALDALAAQSLPPHLIELIVVDDGSTDGTWRYLNELERPRPNIKIFSSRTPEVPALAAIARSPKPSDRMCSSTMPTTTSVPTRCEASSLWRSNRTLTS